MATEEEENFLRSSLLLHKGTFFIAKKILFREQQATGLTLDDLLKNDRRNLESKFKNYKQREILFPPSGQTDVEKWDISLLTGILKTVFTSSLSGAEKQAITNIQCQRNGIIAHTATACLSNDDYTDICEELKEAFDILAFGFSLEVKDQCAAIVHQCCNEALDLKSHVEQLKHMSETDEMLLKILAKIDITKDLVEKILEILKSLHGKQCKRQIKVVDSTLEVSGNDEDSIDLAESIIKTVISEAKRRAKTSEENTHIREIIQEMLDEIHSQSGVSLATVETGCVVIRFECDTYDQLFRLITYMESEDMKERLDKLSISLSHRLPNTKGKLRVSLGFSLETLQIILDELKTYVQTEYKKCVRLPIQFESVEGANRVLDLFYKGSLTNNLKKLSDAVSEKVGAKITVKSSINMEQLHESLEDFGCEEESAVLKDKTEKSRNDEESTGVTGLLWPHTMYLHPYDTPKGSSYDTPKGSSYGTPKGRSYDTSKGRSYNKPEGRSYDTSEERAFDTSEGRSPYGRKNAKQTTQENERRIILLGQHLSDKAPTGNALLGCQVFNDSSDETALKCQVERGWYGNRRYIIVNTPGLTGSDLKLADVLLEIQRSLELCPRPHAFLLILNSRDRNTEEEKYTADILRVTFGEKIFQHCIIVHVNECRELTQFRKTQDNLSILVEKCHDQIIFIEGKHLLSIGKNGDFVVKITELIETVSDNGRRFYQYEFIHRHKMILLNHLKKLDQTLPIQEELSMIAIELGNDLSSQLWTKMLVGGALLSFGLIALGGAGAAAVCVGIAAWLGQKKFFR